MKFSFLVFLLSTLFIGKCKSQTDSTLASSDLVASDAVFLTYTNFRHNTGIKKEKIISTYSKNQLDFVGKTLEKDTFCFQENQQTTCVKAKNVWGFFQNNTFYINFKGSFYRVPVFGSICYLVATVEVINPGFYDPMFGPGVGTNSSRKEIREFLINFHDGNMIEFKMSVAELLLSRDNALFKEFKKLSKRKQREEVFRYIRKYNELHPIYFLK